MITLNPLARADSRAVEALLDAAFGPDRRSKTAYKLREGATPIPELSFAAFEGDMLIGALQSWPVELVDGAGRAEPMVLVGPVAVAPGRQRDGIGRRLMEAMLDAAERLGEDALMLVGDAEYYERFFGFSAAPTRGWRLPGPVDRHRLLARIAGGRRLVTSGTVRRRVERVA